mgnify:CR=1 FL=1
MNECMDVYLSKKKLKQTKNLMMRVSDGTSKFQIGKANS